MSQNTFFSSRTNLVHLGRNFSFAESPPMFSKETPWAPPILNSVRIAKSRNVLETQVKCPRTALFSCVGPFVPVSFSRRRPLRETLKQTRELQHGSRKSVPLSSQRTLTIFWGEQTCFDLYLGEFRNASESGLYAYFSNPISPLGTIRSLVTY